VVAIPAVLAYNVLGRLVRQLSEELDGFAHDLHAYVCAPAGQPQAPLRGQQAAAQQAH
jgi:biopolymer transport protein ExbB